MGLALTASRERARLTGRRRLAATVLAIVGVAFAAAAVPASAGSYTVVSCEAAGVVHGWASDGWAPAWSVPNSGYIACPTNGDPVRGITNRLVNRTFPREAFSLYYFLSPPNTSISLVRWSGRFARGNCAWGTVLRAYPSGNLLTGLPHHSSCGIEGSDFRNVVLDLRPPPGTNNVAQIVECRRAEASYCDPGATFHTNWAAITIEDNQGPAVESLEGRLSAGEWVRGLQPVNFRVSDNVGIQRVTAGIPGVPTSEASFPCSPANARHCPTSPATGQLSLQTGNLSDGLHTLHVNAVDAAGNWSSAHRGVKVDNTAPDAVRPVIEGGSGWRRANSFDLRWSTPPNQVAPITRVHWEACRNASCEGGVRAGDHEGLQDLQVPEPGDHALRVWLEDAAGNQRRPPDYDEVRLRYDPVSPELAFEEQDPAAPLRVAVVVRDEHSGLAGGEVELRRLGTPTWHPLHTSVDGSKLVAEVDDERFRNGSYEFRARAVDAAGNEASTGRRIDGSAASIRLPVRILTRLKVGVRRLVTRPVTIRRGGRRRVVLRRRVTIQPKARVRFGRQITVSGSISNPDGQPIEDATIGVFELIREGRLLEPLGIARADRDGTFRYLARATRTRRLRFYYRGSSRIRSAARDVLLEVPAHSTIAADRARARNGQSVTFSGRVPTRPLPSAGKLVEVQAYFRGRWRTFSTTRTDHRGRWRFRYRFGGTVGRVEYRFRVQLPREGGYPFATGRSRVIRVTVTEP